MHIPSERTHQKLLAEAAFFQVVPANRNEISIIIKCPSSAIKALISGCEMEILFGRKEDFICTGVRIKDVPDSPTIISGVLLDEEDHESFRELLQKKRCAIFLFNEMDICLAWTNIQVNAIDFNHAEEIINEINSTYVGAFNEACSHALDCFCSSIDDSQEYDSVSSIAIKTLGTAFESWRINNNIFIGARDSHEIVISDSNEGEVFERAIWASLESVFPLTLHKGPQVKIGNKVRELTDILSYHKYGSFMIEAKDLSVIEAGYDRSIDRKVKGVQKQVKKAIGQLVGSVKAFQRGEAIFDCKGDEIKIDRKIPPHCIILITELLHFGDWSEIEDDLISAIESTGAFFNLLDLREFITLLKGSRGKSELLDYNLMERCKSFAMRGSVHLRSQITPSFIKNEILPIKI